MRRVNEARLYILASLAVLWAGLTVSCILGAMEIGWSPLSNALSDLGAVGSPLRPVFNTTLVLSGILLAAGSTLLRDRLLFLASLFEALVGVLDESLGFIHYLVAAMLFTLLTLYVWLRCSRSAAILMLLSWMPYLMREIHAAIPEFVNASIASLCILNQAHGAR